MLPLESRVARWDMGFVYQKVVFWVYVFCRALDICWYMLWPLGIFYGNLVHFVVIWYIYSWFGKLYQDKSGNPVRHRETENHRRCLVLASIDAHGLDETTWQPSWAAKGNHKISSRLGMAAISSWWPRGLGPFLQAIPPVRVEETVVDLLVSHDQPCDRFTGFRMNRRCGWCGISAAVSPCRGNRKLVYITWFCNLRPPY
jgi:hypothetical protein